MLRRYIGTQGKHNRKLADLGLHCYLKMLLKDNFIHADLVSCPPLCRCMCACIKQIAKWRGQAGLHKDSCVHAGRASVGLDAVLQARPRGCPRLLRGHLECGLAQYGFGQCALPTGCAYFSTLPSVCSTPATSWSAQWTSPVATLPPPSPPLQHPGNILVRLEEPVPGGLASRLLGSWAQHFKLPRLVLLDVGMIARLSTEDQHNLVGFFKVRPSCMCANSIQPSSCHIVRSTALQQRACRGGGTQGSAPATRRARC